METRLVVTTFDHTLRIPPNFKNLVGREGFVKELKAEEPTQLPTKIAEYYVTNWSKKYRYADAQEMETFTLIPGNDAGNKEKEPKEFDPLQFLEDNFQNIEEAVNALTDRKQIFELAKTLKFGSGYHTQKNDRLKERIINDVKTKNAHQDELEKNKGVS